MAYKQISPQAVAEGGTGATTLTDHGILVGSGTSAITALAVGTNGQLCIGSTGADPVFATVTSSDSLLTLTGGAGTLDIVAQNAVSSSSTLTDFAVVCGSGGTRGVQSVAGLGTSGQVLTSNGAGVLPTFQDASGDVTGPGSSTDNALARWNGAGGDTLQDSTVIVTDNGEMTNASQPAFLAYQPTDDANVTGDGTVYSLGDTDVGTSLTEVFDQNSDLNPGASGGAIFTAPVTGKYHLGVLINYRQIVSASSTAVYAAIVTSNRTFADYVGISASASDTQAWGINGLADMDAADTCTFQSQALGASKTVDIDGSTNMVTYINGSLIC